MAKQSSTLFRPRGGRNKLSEKEALIKRLNLRLDQATYEQLMEAFRASGYPYLTEYLRKRLLETQHLYVTNPKEIFQRLDAIGSQMGRIGNNINQLAKYIHLLQTSGTINPTILEEINSTLLEYNQERKELALAIRSLLKRNR